MTEQKPDYTSFLALFHDGLLTLADGLVLSEEIGQQLEETIEAALSNGLAALPEGAAIEILNQDQLIAQRLPYVQIRIGPGVLTHPAIQLRRLSFSEVIDRLASEAEAFKLFLMQREVLNWSQYLKALWIWKRVNPDLIRDFRIWLRGIYAVSEHETKLQAVALYCRLAQADGVLSAQEVEKIIKAIDQPLPRKKRR